MSEWGVVSEIWSWIQSAGTLGAVYLAAKFYLDRRRLIQAAESDEAIREGGDWARLRAEIDRLDGRCDHLQSEVDDCRQREGVWMSRAMVAEAKLQGQGEVNQAAAVAQAEVRVDPVEAPTSVARFAKGEPDG